MRSLRLWAMLATVVVLALILAVVAVEPMLAKANDTGIPRGYWVVELDGKFLYLNNVSKTMVPEYYYDWTDDPTEAWHYGAVDSALVDAIKHGAMAVPLRVVEQRMVRR